MLRLSLNELLGVRIQRRNHGSAEYYFHPPIYFKEGVNRHSELTICVG